MNLFFVLKLRCLFKHIQLVLITQFRLKLSSTSQPFVSVTLMDMQSTTSVGIGRNSLQAADNGTDRTVTSVDTSTAKVDVAAAAHTDSELELTPVSVISSTNGSTILDGTFFRIVSVGEDGKVCDEKLSALHVRLARNHCLELLHQQLIS